MDINVQDKFKKNIDEPCTSSFINLLPEIDMDITEQEKCNSYNIIDSVITNLQNIINTGKKNKTTKLIIFLCNRICLQYFLYLLIHAVIFLFYYLIINIY